MLAGKLPQLVGRLLEMLPPHDITRELLQWGGVTKEHPLLLTEMSEYKPLLDRLALSSHK